MRNRLFQTSLFRLSALYAAVLSASVLLILLTLYTVARRTVDRDTDTIIETELGGLTAEHREAGLDGLAKAINSRLSDADERGAIYLLTDSALRYRAGNIAQWPSGGTTEGRWVRLQVKVKGAGMEDTHAVRAAVVRLPDGNHLLVGHVMDAGIRLERLIQESLAMAIAVTITLSLVGGMIMSRRVLRRVDLVARTSSEIAQGDLSRRLALSGSGDEFDRLAENVNRMLEQLERLTIGMRTVIDSVAHDFRGALNRLTARAELALMSYSDQASLRSALENVLAEAAGIGATLDSLLRIVQLETSESAWELTQCVDLGSLATETLELYEPVAEEAGLVTDLAVEDGALVRGNRELIAQAIANLLDNAVKYTPAGGTVAVKVTLADDGARLEVSDTGPGIRPADRRRVLERFVRLDTSRSTPGAGLGLSLVAAVARIHGARLELGDAQPGLRVWLMFPRATNTNGNDAQHRSLSPT